MKNTVYILTLITATMLSISCNSNNVNGIIVSEIILISSSERDIDYKGILKAALSGDTYAIRELVLLDFHNATSYDHGAVIVDLIGRIGEDKFLAAINGFGNKEKYKLCSLILTGLEYGDNLKYKCRNLDDAFPKIYIYLEGIEMRESKFHGAC